MATVNNTTKRRASLPLVSVVIPTYLRPDLVRPAVDSVLAQTFENIEVIVIVDGRDDETLQVMARITDSRLRVHVPDKNLGQSQARNAGVDLAKGEWVAFLDDDDTWMPHKLQEQLTIAESSPAEYPVVSCRLIARTETNDFIWPRRFPKKSESISDYLFCRHSFFYGEGLLQTSTLLTRRELLQHLPFESRLQRFVDLEWVLQADRRDDVAFHFVSSREPLAIWHIETNRPRISNELHWQTAVDWIRTHKHTISQRAISGFLLGDASSGAGQAQDWSAFLPLLQEAFRAGRPSVTQLANHTVNFMAPRKLKQSAAHILERLRKPRDTRRLAP